MYFGLTPFLTTAGFINVGGAIPMRRGAPPHHAIVTQRYALVNQALG
jgi:hypothetical protein